MFKLVCLHTLFLKLFICGDYFVVFICGELFQVSTNNFFVVLLFGLVFCLITCSIYCCLDSSFLLLLFISNVAVH